MHLTETVTTFLSTAPHKALATCGPEGLNVVPVSTITVNDDTVYLYDFFMVKTTKNIRQNTEVALVCWEGFKGVQIKAVVAYETDTPRFTEANEWAKLHYPERTLKGLLVLTPTAVYDVSVGDTVIET